MKSQTPPTDCIEYIVSSLIDTPTEDLQILYTWLGKSKPAFKLRGAIRRTIESRTNRPCGTSINFNESKYLDDMAQASFRDNRSYTSI